MILGTKDLQNKNTPLPDQREQCAEVNNLEYILTYLEG